MQKDVNEEISKQTDANDEELHDVLIAISIVAKRLATKLNENQKTKGEEKVCTNIMD